MTAPSTAPGAAPGGSRTTVQELDSVTIRFAGDSGDGMQLAGTQFTNASAILGNDISTLPDFPAESILFLGRDDFSFLRGRRFGTILVNLETRHVVDLLPDRKAETSASWMRQYPDLMAVSRDRGGDYAAAATAGAPQAIQCADRFHVIVRHIGACSIPLGERRS